MDGDGGAAAAVELGGGGGSMSNMISAAAACCPQCMERCHKEHGFGAPPKASTPRHPCFIRTAMDHNLRSWMQIPKAFVDLHGGSFRGSTVDLEGPSGKIWLVDVHSPGHGVAGFKLGWRVFATYNRLKAGDLLLFTLVAKARFTVHVFNRLGLETSPVPAAAAAAATAAVTAAAAASDPPAAPCGAPYKGEADDDQMEGSDSSEAADDSDCSSGDEDSLDSGCDSMSPNSEFAGAGRSSSVKRESGAETSNHSPSIQDILKEYGFDNGRATSPKLKPWPQHPGHNKRPAPRMLPERPGGALEPGWNSRTYESRRRPVTDAERARAMADAVEFKTEHPSVVILMKPSHVYRGFWLTIPSDFAKAHMPHERVQILLQDAFDFQWPASWVVSKNHSGVSGGWAAFSLDHRLEEGDVCAFEVPGPSGGNGGVLRVHIFRVAEVADLEPGTRGGWEAAYNLVRGKGYRTSHGNGLGSRRSNDPGPGPGPPRADGSRARKSLAKVLYAELQNGQFAKRNRRTEFKPAAVQGFQDADGYEEKPKVGVSRGPPAGNAEIFSQPGADVKPTSDELRASLKPVKNSSARTPPGPLPACANVKREVPVAGADVKLTPEQLRAAFTPVGGDPRNIGSVGPARLGLVDEGIATRPTGGLLPDGDGNGTDPARTWFAVSRIVNKRQDGDEARKEFLVELVDPPAAAADPPRDEEGYWWVPCSHFSPDLSSCYLS